MPTFTLTHEIQCNEETFWKVFFENAFNEELYQKVLGFPEYLILQQDQTDTQITRRVIGQPKMNMPGPVAKLLGSGFRYTEEGRFDKAQRVYSWKMTPSTLADKLRQEGSVRVEPAGDNKVRRIATMINEAKVFGIGGLIESSAEKQLREGWDRSAVFLNKWIAGAVK